MFSLISKIFGKFGLVLSKLNLVAWGSGGSENFDTQWDGSIAGGRHPTESFGPNTFNHPNTWGMYAGAGKMKLADDMQAHGAAVYAPCDKQLGKNGPH